MSLVATGFHVWLEDILSPG